MSLGIAGGCPEPADLEAYFIFFGFYDKRSKYIIPKSKISKTLEIMVKIYTEHSVQANRCTIENNNQNKILQQCSQLKPSV